MEGTLTLARIVLKGLLIWLAARAVNRTCLGWHRSRWGGRLAVPEALR